MNRLSRRGRTQGALDSAAHSPALVVLPAAFLVLTAFTPAPPRPITDPEAIEAQGAEVLGHAWYVAPDGDDSHSGATTSDPWKTLQHAVLQLQPGDTLFLRGGTYLESEISVDVAGVAGAPITIRNYPGEQPVVDGAYPEFRTAPNQAWELIDADKQIYGSVDTYPDAGEVFGYYGTADGSWRLVPYEATGPFGTDNEDYSDGPPYYYIGPGVYWNSSDLRIYYRSHHSMYQDQDIRVPANPDPRQTALYIFPKQEVLKIESTCSYLVLEGLDIRNQYNALNLEPGSHHVTVRNCNVLGGRYHILVRGGAHDLTFDGITVADRFPDWVAWSDVKRPASASPGHLLQGSAIQLSDDVDGVEIMNCAFTGLFDAIGAGQTPTNLHVHDNLFDVRDDVLQLGSAGWNIEFDHNRVLRAHSGGPSWNGSGNPPPSQIGSIFIHHNVIDTSELQRFGRSDPLGLLDSGYQGPKGDGFAAGRTFGSHDKEDITGPAPWKIYYNTAIVRDDESDGGAGQTYRIKYFDPTRPHEVYNNIFVQLGDEWLLREARADDGSQIYDGNLYWAPNRTPGTDLFEDVWNRGSPNDFATLAQFLGSNSCKATRLYYPPGWEHSGVEADPQLDSHFRPHPGGPAASGAVDLSSKNWPGLTGETFRGAIAPGSSTGTLIGPTQKQ